jgi:hypothetical protein
VLWSGAAWLVPSGGAGNGSVTSGAACARTAWPRPPCSAQRTWGTRAKCRPTRSCAPASTASANQAAHRAQLLPPRASTRVTGRVQHPAAREASAKRGCILCKCTV